MVSLEVSNLRCMGCVRNIQEELSEYDPKVKLTADIPKGLISFETTLETEVIMIILRKAGYLSKDVTKMNTPSS